MKLCVLRGVRGNEHTTTDKGTCLRVLSHSVLGLLGRKSKVRVESESQRAQSDTHARLSMA